MKSQELHRHLRASLGPWFRQQGFTTAKKTALGWSRDPILIWIQCDARGWDRPSDHVPVIARFDFD